jgi:hypothetical protein
MAKHKDEPTYWLRVYELTGEKPYDDKLELRGDLPDNHRVVETFDGVYVEVAAEHGWRTVATSIDEEVSGNDFLHSEYGVDPPYGSEHRVAVTENGYEIERWEGRDDD